MPVLFLLTLAATQSMKAKHGTLLSLTTLKKVKTKSKRNTYLQVISFIPPCGLSKGPWSHTGG